MNHFDKTTTLITIDTGRIESVNKVQTWPSSVRVQAVGSDEILYEELIDLYQSDPGIFRAIKHPGPCKIEAKDHPFVKAVDVYLLYYIGPFEGRHNAGRYALPPGGSLTIEWPVALLKVDCSNDQPSSNELEQP